jgi:cation/acetate symporter
VKPLLGLPHAAGVIMVGTVVMVIVVTAGMVSTTWVQFIKGGLLVIFCGMLTIAILARGIVPVQGIDTTSTITPSTQPAAAIAPAPFIPVPKSGVVITGPSGNVPPANPSLGPVAFIGALNQTDILQYTKTTSGGVTSYQPKVVNAGDLLAPGGSSTFKGIRSEKLVDRLDFVSLMLALFCGTASLPHILIRYYTVKDAASARKSTVVGIAAIGFFYVLTLYIGLGAMVSGNLDPSDTNMAAPLLAKSFGDLPFAIITAIAFTTVLGTVSGLILAASGAVAHDLIEHVFGHKLKENAKVGAAKWAALVVGIIAMALGILFEKLNVSFLVGWAFNVAASANLPALVMLLFWTGTTKQGVIYSIVIGLFGSLAWLLLSAPAMTLIYGLPASYALVPDQKTPTGRRS